MRTAHLFAALVVTTCMMWSTQAAAQGFAFKMENQSSQLGSAPPVLVLQATDIVKKGTVKLTSPSAKNKTVKLKGMNAGSTKRIKLDVPKGTHTYTVAITVTGVAGEVTVDPFTVTVARVAPINIKIDKARIDLNKGVAPFTVNRPLQTMEVELYDKTNTLVGSHTQDFGGQYGSLDVEWPAVDGVAFVKFKATDVDKFWTYVEFENWFINIPHEDIIFDTGKDSWRDGETPKLDKALEDATVQIKKYKKYRPDLALYVGGYTDSVGNAADNQRLSEARARAIARWFKKRGIGIPVYAQGFGEDAQAVKTADNVDEARNRRAVYVLGTSTPPSDASMPKRNWKRVK